MDPKLVIEAESNDPTNLFDPLVILESVIGGDSIQIKPEGVINDTGPYTFNFPNNGRYIDANKTEFCLEFKIVDNKGENVKESDCVSFVNLPADSFISDIDIYINGKLINQLSNSYVNYKSFLEHVIYYDEVTLKHHLKTAVMRMDTVGKYDDMSCVKFTQERLADFNANPELKDEDKCVSGDIDEEMSIQSKNAGFFQRRALIKKGGICQVVTQLPFDLLQTIRYIPPGLSLSFKITRASDKFLILADADAAAKGFKIQVLNMYLNVRYVDLREDIVNSHREALKEEKYVMLPFKRVRDSYRLQNTGVKSLHWTGVYANSLPHVVLVGFLKHSAVEGDYQKNPYNFVNAGITEIYMKENGGRMVPSVPYTPDFKKGLIIPEYRTFLNSVNIYYKNKTNMVDLKTWRDGITVFAFDFSADGSSGNKLHEKKKGHIDLYVKFEKELTEPLTVLCFGTSTTAIGINKDFNIILYE